MMSDKADQWTEYWSNEGAGGEVFVNREGNKHPALRHFWRDTLSGLPANTRILDLACGAGSIYADLPEGADYQLVAADLSEKAIQTLKNRMPDVETLVCSATDVPMPDGAFDMVVSQFGIEYAGIDGFKEAARLVKKNGKLRILTHIEDGFIDKRNQRELAGIALVESTAFLERAIEVMKSTASDNELAAKAAVDAFTQVEPELAKFTEENPFGFHAHLYSGFRQMFCNRARYEDSDIVDWLEAMRQEMLRSRGRISEIRSATVSADGVEKIRSLLTGAGFQNIKISPFSLPDYREPVAWSIAADKP